MSRNTISFYGAPASSAEPCTGFRVMPHDVQESKGEGTGAEGGVRGDAGGAAGITRGLISPSLAPQTPQNFSPEKVGCCRKHRSE